MATRSCFWSVVNHGPYGRVMLASDRNTDVVPPAALLGSSGWRPSAGIVPEIPTPSAPRIINEKSVGRM